jgi:aspartate racemase
VYYRLANELVRDRLGGLHSARLVLHSVDFADIAELQREDRWAEAGEVLVQAAKGLESAGAELLLIGTNTMHIVAGQVQSAVSVPLLHIGDVTAGAVTGAGLRRVGLLGTRFTMERPFLREHLAERGVDTVVPGTADRDTVHRVIYEELCRGIVRDESRAVVREVIGRLVDDGAEGVVLACTELELLVGAADSPVPVFPTTRLHVEAAVEAAMQG